MYMFIYLLIYFGRLIKKLEHTWKALVHDGVRFFFFSLSNIVTGSQRYQDMYLVYTLPRDVPGFVEIKYLNIKFAKE